MRGPTLTTIGQHNFGCDSYGNQREKKNNKIVHIGKEEVKSSLFEDDVILYICSVQFSSVAPSCPTL